MSNILEHLPEDERKCAKKTSMPDWVEPMLAKLTHDYFSDPDWIFERKLDGERVIAYISPQGEISLMSRNEKNLNDNYPEIVDALSEQVEVSCILDGEVVAFDENGVSDFQRLQPRMQASSLEEAKESNVRVHYYIFDCPYIDGYDITDCSIRNRKKMLKEIVDWGDPIHWTSHRNEDGIEFYKEACSKGWEGLIAKDASSGYQHSRSSSWLKFKCIMQQEFVIGGFTEPSGERVGFGALLLGFYRNGDLVYAGEVGTGFDDETLESLRSKFKSIQRKTSPFDQGEPETKDVHFVTPKHVCEVAFTEWTRENRLRHPRYKGLRWDKNPENVHKEDESQMAELDS